MWENRIWTSSPIKEREWEDRGQSSRTRGETEENHHSRTSEQILNFQAPEVRKRILLLKPEICGSLLRQPWLPDVPFGVESVLIPLNVLSEYKLPKGSLNLLDLGFLGLGVAHL